MVIELIKYRHQVTHLYSNIYAVECCCGCGSIEVFCLNKSTLNNSCLECIVNDNNKYEIGYLYHICNYKKFIQYLEVNN